MKKYIYLLAFTCLLNSQLTAQVYYHQDFEDGMGDMIVRELTGQTLLPQYEDLQEGWGIRGYDFCGLKPYSSKAISSAHFDPIGDPIDAWMITPAIDVDQEGLVLSWNSTSVFPARVQYQVLISTTGTNTEDFTEIVFEIDGEGGPTDTRCRERSVNLDNFIGSTIHIGFRHIGYRINLAIDDIVVEKIDLNKVEMLEISTIKYHQMGSTAPIKGTIKNTGRNSLNLIEMRWSHGDSIITEIFDGLDISPLDTFYYEFSQGFTVNLLTEEEIKVEVIAVNGEASEEFQNLYIHGLTEIPTPTVVYEMGVGPWCGYCPLSYAVIEYLEEKYDNFIGIAVHKHNLNEEIVNPMSIQDYEELEFNNFPRYNANRIYNNTYVFSTGFDLYYDLFNSSLHSPLKVEAEATFRENSNRLLTVEANALFYGDFTDQDFRFSVIVLEDSIRGVGSEFDQVNLVRNSYKVWSNGLYWYDETDPVPASRMHYNNVPIAILGGYRGEIGSIPSTINAGEGVTKTFYYDVPEESIPENLKVVVMVLDGASGEIVNAFETKVDISTSQQNVFTSNSTINLYPNPVGEILNLEFELENNSGIEYKIFNTLGQEILSKKKLDNSGKIIITENVHMLPSGTYNLIMTINGENIMKKFIKE